MKRAQMIGMIYNPVVPAAHGLASALVERLELNGKAWMCHATEADPELPQAKDTDLIITVGGDGTIIRAARLSVPWGIPILGINMGRLGFMTELEADEALEKVPQYLEGNARVEERFMLQVEVLPGKIRQNRGGISGNGGCYHALNDAVVTRGGVSRLIRIGACIDGAHLTDFRADALIVSTSTGSTGYNLSVGGPILPPEAGAIIIKAVAPHVGIAPALVLPSESVIELTVETDHQAMVSVDGYLDTALTSGDGIRVRTSTYKSRFLRAHPPTHFYSTLTQRLGFGGGQSTTRAIQY